MSPKQLLILFIVLSYTGVVLIYRRKKISLLGGMEYLLVGLLFSLVSVDQALLKPLLYAFIGWIGLLTGMQMKVEYVSRLDRSFYGRVFVYTLVFFCLVFAFLSIVVAPVTALYMAIGLLPVSYLVVARYCKENRYVLFFASIMPFVAVAYLFFVTVFQSDGYTLSFFFLIIACFAIIARFIITNIDDKRSIELILIGLIILISESCAVLNCSALLVTFAVGMYLANFCPLDDVVFIALYKDEKPLYSIFLLLVGMLAGMQASFTFFLQGMAVVVFVAGLKYVLFKIPFFNMPPHYHRYMQAPGGFAVTIGVDSWLNQGVGLQTGWFSLFLFIVLMLQFISVFISRSYE